MVHDAGLTPFEILISEWTPFGFLLGFSLIVFCQFTNGSGDSLITLLFESICFCTESSSQLFLFFSRRETVNAPLIEKFTSKSRTHIVGLLFIQRFGHNMVYPQSIGVLWSIRQYLTNLIQRNAIVAGFFCFLNDFSQPFLKEFAIENAF